MRPPPFSFILEGIKLKLRINDSAVDWLSPDSCFFFNPLDPKAAGFQDLARELPFFPGHVYLFSSGGRKICLISKKAFLHSARAVNRFLGCCPEDCWALSLPLFHTGGLAILARSFCGGFSYTEIGKKKAEGGVFIWNPKKWREEAEARGATLASFVPAQVYDLVQNGLPPPKKLRAAVVGGGPLSPALYKKARGLGWPLLPSYGLTEAASQAATAELSSLKKSGFPKLKILPHMQIQADLRGGGPADERAGARPGGQAAGARAAGARPKEARGPDRRGGREQALQLKIKSPALLSGVFDLKTGIFEDPKNREGWLALDDLGEARGGFLEIRGRKDEMIKILGETADLRELSLLLSEISSSSEAEFQLAAVPHERLGFELNLITSSFDQKEIAGIAEEFNRRAPPPARARKAYCVPQIKKSPLLKTRQRLLREQIGLCQ